MKSLPRLSFLTALLCALSLAAPAAEPKTVRLLTVGNSFSQNATHLLPDLVKADGNVLIHHPCVVPSSPLQVHWEMAQRFESDPQDPKGRYSSGRSLREELGAERWDFITIQQYSFRSHDLASYHPYAEQLRAYLHAGAPQAELLLHETWEYRSDDPRFTGPPGAAGEPHTQEEMYRKVQEAYATVAKELGVRRLPVGDAFHLVDTDPQWAFHPDTAFKVAEAKAPELPDQTHSLHVGWKWIKVKKDVSALKMDGHHADTAGEYLGACVWYEILFGHTSVGNSFVPAGLDPDFAHYLQATAHRAVLAEAKEETALSLPRSAP